MAACPFCLWGALQSSRVSYRLQAQIHASGSAERQEAVSYFKAARPGQAPNPRPNESSDAWPASPFSHQAAQHVYLQPIVMILAPAATSL